VSAKEEFDELSASDEIDLRDLVLAIFEGWYWIVGAVVVAVIASFTYVSAVTPVYTTELKFNGHPDGLRALNNMPGTSYTSGQVVAELSQRVGSYENFQRYLEESEETRVELFDYFDVGAGEEDAVEKVRRLFFANFSVSSSQEGEGEEDPASVDRLISLSYSEGMQGPELVNDYYSWSVSDYKEALVDRAEQALDNSIARNEKRMDAQIDAYEADVDARITRMREADEIKIKELVDSLNAEKKAIKSFREKRIRDLEEAERIASMMGIEKPTTPIDLGGQSSERDIIYTGINSQSGLPLYFMGTDALSSEREVVESNLENDVKNAEIIRIEKQIEEVRNNRQIEALEQRKENSPFVEEYNKMVQENIMMRANIVNVDDIRVAEVIHWAYQPSQPDSPRKALILALSLVLGGMVGLFLVFVVRMLHSVKGYREAKV